MRPVRPQIAALRPELAGRDGCAGLRQRLGIRPVFKTVDTCAAEFEAKTPYHYSSYELDRAAETPPRRPTKPKVLILGSGPNRIGQGIEFDYSCVHAATTLREPGSRPSWSTATRRPCPPTTTPPTGCTSSR